MISDTERFFGYNRTRMNQDGEQVAHQGSRVASLNHNVSVYAGKDYHQAASDVLAKENVSVQAQNIMITNIHNHQESSHSESDLKIGQFTRVKSPLFDLLNSIESAVKNDRASDRLKAANAMSLAAQGYSLYDNISKLKDPKANTYLFRVESGSGVAHSRQSQESVADISQGSRVNAKNINLVARGDGSLNEKGEKKLGNINLTHTDLTSRDETGARIKDSHLSLTGKDIRIQAGESHSTFKGRSQSVGVEVGMAATVGAQTGVGIYARVGASGGKEDGESKTYQASHLDSETITLNSQGDTNLIGSQAKGKAIHANVGGKLNIESLQDEEKFKTKSSGGGIEVEFGFGNNWSLSGYGNASKGTTHRKQVNEQAGLFAEEGGYHISANHIHLKGGAIASTAPQTSELKTNSLTFEDIKNESSSQAASASISGSLKGKVGEPAHQNAQDERAASQNSADNTEKGNPIQGNQQGGLSPGLPMYEQSSDSSITRATLTEGRIILNKDTAPTQTTAAALGINTDLNQANHQTAQTKDVKEQIQEQQQIATAIGHVKSAVETYTNNLYAEAKQQEAQAKVDFEQGKMSEQDYRAAVERTESWGTGGANKRIVDTVTAVITSAIAGKSGAELATIALSPTINQKIKEATTDKTTGEVDKITNAVAHAVWGGIESAAAGGNIASGAVSAASAELAAPLIAKALYGTDSPKALTEEQKQNIVNLSSLAGTISSGIVNSNSSGVEMLTATTQGAEIGKRAVENNYLLEQAQKSFEEEMVECKSKGGDCSEVVKKHLDISNKNSKELHQMCSEGGIRCAGREEIIDAATNMARVKYDTSGRFYLGTPLQDDDTIRIVNYLNERDLSYLKDKVSATDRLLYQAMDITNWPFLLIGGRNLLLNNSKEALLATGVTTGVNAGIQYSLTGDIKTDDLISAGVLGKMTAGKSYSTTVNLNTGGAYYFGKVNGEDNPALSALISRTASIAGYNVGVKVENKLNYYLNPTRDKYTWIDSGYLGISYQRKPSVIPSSVGNVFDSITSENITKDLNGNREGKK